MKWNNSRSRARGRRISSALWEQDWFANSGFYTNRIAFQEMLNAFEAVGFSVDVVQVDRWEALPTSIARMAPEFRDLDAAALLISGFDVVLKQRRA